MELKPESLLGSKPAKYAQRYSDEDKRIALELYVEVGPTEASRRCGVAAPTIRNWGRAAGLETRAAEGRETNIRVLKSRWEERRVLLAEGIGDLAEEALELSRDYVATGDARNARDAAATMATAVDKAQLLTGGVTERVGVDETYQTREREIEQARAAAREIASRAQAAIPPAPEVPLSSTRSPGPPPDAGSATSPTAENEEPLPAPVVRITSPDIPAEIEKPPRNGIIPVPGP